MPVLLKHVRHVPVTTRTKPSLHIRIKTHLCSGRRHTQRRRLPGERLECAAGAPMCGGRGSPPPSGCPMFRFFETLVDPFPAVEPRQPPRRLPAFLFHYSRPLLPFLALVSVLTAAISVAEVVFIGFMGRLVDRLGSSDPATFFADHGRELAGMALLVVVIYPLLVLMHSLLTHQTIFGNYPMLERWLSHRWLLGQRQSFFQDVFAGRFAKTVWKTALDTRER